MGTNGSLSEGKGLRSEADHSPPSTAKVKNAWSSTFTPPIPLHGVVLSTQCIWGWVGPHSRPGHGVAEKNSQPPPGIEPRSADRPARSQSLYRLTYPSSRLGSTVLRILFWWINYLFLCGFLPFIYQKHGSFCKLILIFQMQYIPSDFPHFSYWKITNMFITHEITLKYINFSFGSILFKSSSIS
jgi:hypothetical protein